VTNGRPDHAWFRARVLAFRLGLLEDSEERALLDHAAECDTCRALLQSFVETESTESSRDIHIPSGMIARWERARQELTGLERAMVRQHLGRCADCRRELEFLGFEPTLEHVAGRELETPTREASEGLPREEETDKERRGSKDSVLKRGRRSLVRNRPLLVRWGVTGWAVAATAAALLLLARTEAPEAPPATSGLVPWVQPGLVRGDEEAISIEVSPEVRVIALPIVVPVSLLEDSEISIEIRSPSGIALLRTVVHREDIRSGTFVVFLRTARRFEDGLYEVLLRSGRLQEDVPYVERNYFRVRTTGAP